MVAVFYQRQASYAWCLCLTHEVNRVTILTMKICENCPDANIVEFNEGTRKYAQDELTRINNRIGQCGLSQKLSAEKPKLHREAEACEHLLNKCDVRYPKDFAEAAECCHGPFVQTHTTPEGYTYETRICGAEVTTKNIWRHGSLVETPTQETAPTEE